MKQPQHGYGTMDIVRWSLLVGVIVTAFSAGTALPDEATSTCVARLIEDLESNDADTRLHAIESLAALGTDAKPAVMVLTRILENRQSPFRVAVANAFNQILPAHVDMLAVFPDLRFAGKVPPVAYWPPARRAKFAEATKLANDETAKALEIALPALVNALRDDDDYLREYSAMSLGACGSLAKNAVPALIQTLEDEKEPVRMRAVEALERIGPDAAEAVGPLMEYIKRHAKSYVDVRTPAIQALGAIGPAAKDAVPMLLNLLQDAREPRYPAAEALGKIGRGAENAIPALVTALNDKEDLVRACAAEAIGKIGSRTPLLIAALEEAAKDEDSYVRMHAERALKQLSSAREGRGTAYGEERKRN